jgi:hypothetical protein
MDYGVITWFEGRNKRVGDIRYQKKYMEWYEIK